jgi:hypothetical protein
MSKSDFDAFVKRQQIEQQEAAQQEVVFDPKQQLSEWLDYLDALYKQITTYLRTYIDSGAAQIDYRDVRLNEEFSGPYMAKEMILKIGRPTVTFTPIGTMLIGMKGRVDVQGPAGRATLFLLNKLATSAQSLIRVTITRPGQSPPPPPSAEAIRQIEWVWKISTPPPEMKFIELTQEAFFEMVLEVANA